MLRIVLVAVVLSASTGCDATPAQRSGRSALEEPRTPSAAATAQTSVGSQRLVTFGHSWVAGRYPDPRVVPWADRVAAAEDLVLDNRGVGAAEATDTLATVRAYRPRAADTVVVEAVLNDVRRYGPGGIPPFRRTLRALLDHLATAATPPRRTLLAIDAPIVAWRGDPSGVYDHGSDATLRRYGLALRRVAATFEDRLRIGVVDLGRGWSTASDITTDGIHPSDAGMARIARRVVTALAGLDATTPR